VAALVWALLNWKALTPEAASYIRSYVAGERVVTATMSFMDGIFESVPFELRKGMPPSFYFVFAALKLTPAVLIAAAAGILIAVLQRRPAHRIALAWLGLWFATFLLSGTKYGRFFVSVLPVFLLFAAHAAIVLAGSALRIPVALVPLLIPVLLVAGEARAALGLAPHYRLYLSPLAGARGPEWFFPHCDYFDAGFREAMQVLAARAEAGAEVTSEIELPARFYTARGGRDDLVHTLLREGTACRSGRVCYVVTQVGRRYRHNQRALAYLAERAPWHVERIRHRAAVAVYRLMPGESPFPATGLFDPR